MALHRTQFAEAYIRYPLPQRRGGGREKREYISKINLVIYTVWCINVLFSKRPTVLLPPFLLHITQYCRSYLPICNYCKWVFCSQAFALHPGFSPLKDRRELRSLVNHFLKQKYFDLNLCTQPQVSHNLLKRNRWIRLHNRYPSGFSVIHLTHPPSQIWTHHSMK